MESRPVQRGRLHRFHPQYRVCLAAAAPAHLAQAHRQRTAILCGRPRQHRQPHARTYAAGHRPERWRAQRARRPEQDGTGLHPDADGKAAVQRPHRRGPHGRARLCGLADGTGCRAGAERQCALLPHRQRPVRAEICLRYPGQRQRRADVPESPGRARKAARAHGQPVRRAVGKNHGRHGQAGGPHGEDRHGDRQAVQQPRGARQFRAGNPPPDPRIAGMGDQPQPADDGPEKAPGRA